MPLITLITTSRHIFPADEPSATSGGRRRDSQVRKRRRPASNHRTTPLRIVKVNRGTPSGRLPRPSPGQLFVFPLPVFRLSLATVHGASCLLFLAPISSPRWTQRRTARNCTTPHLASKSTDTVLLATHPACPRRLPERANHDANSTFGPSNRAASTRRASATAVLTLASPRSFTIEFS